MSSDKLQNIRIINEELTTMIMENRASDLASTHTTPGKHFQFDAHDVSFVIPNGTACESIRIDVVPSKEYIVLEEDNTRGCWNTSAATVHTILCLICL